AGWPAPIQAPVEAPYGVWVMSARLSCRAGLPSGLLAGSVRGGLVDVVDEAVLLGLGRREPAVAVGVGLDLLHALPGVLGDELGHLLLDVQHLLGLDLDVGGGAADPAGGLVHHHP